MWSSYENIWTFLIIVLMALITPNTVTVYTRDQLLTLRSSPALLNHRVCLQVASLACADVAAGLGGAGPAGS